MINFTPNHAAHNNESNRKDQDDNADQNHHDDHLCKVMHVLRALKISRPSPPPDHTWGGHWFKLIQHSPPLHHQIHEHSESGL